jgi:CBS domain-containing protein
MRTVEQVMTRRVATVRPQTPFKQVVQLLRARRVSAAPVVDEQGRLLGVVAEADLALKQEQEHPPAQPPRLLPHPGLRREQRKAAATTAADLMTTSAVTIHPHAPLSVAARLLHRRGVRHLPVVDAGGRLVGHRHPTGPAGRLPPPGRRAAPGGGPPGPRRHAAAARGGAARHGARGGGRAGRAGRAAQPGRAGGAAGRLAGRRGRGGLAAGVGRSGKSTTFARRRPPTAGDPIPPRSAGEPTGPAISRHDQPDAQVIRTLSALVSAARAKVSLDLHRLGHREPVGGEAGRVQDAIGPNLQHANTIRTARRHPRIARLMAHRLQDLRQYNVEAPAAMLAATGTALGAAQREGA